ncbi:conjugal transfer protein TraI [Ohtaekwangia koreensis]|uniref:conjugal transfer protein TraI n=1 Tax=Ohtaekwangia koreensis TaxID=688867 RepID=UPI0009A57217|nr:conjugal transfer protein TraI [Ohtaekwangia koreensis]
MKKIGIILFLTTVCLTVTPTPEVKAAIPILKIIKEAVKKVIKAVDLMIQRLQNKTIWLQNAQKVLENKLSELKLTEIAEWTEKHRKLYQEYYEELWKVKNALAAYQRIREIMDKQVRIVDEYKRAWNLVRQDKHFTESEIDYMYRVYTGILNESVKNLDQVLLVINSFKTQMTDAQRLAIITQAGDRIEQNFIDLLEFNMNTYQISLNRARTQSEVDRVKKLYGL